MADEFDIEAYFRRIQYTGDRQPTLDTLRAIHFQHATNIAFENLNPLLRWPVRLDTLSLQQKLVNDGRGGWCFEQNLLLSHGLKRVGFRVKGLAGRVLWNLPEDTAPPPRGHMLLRIDLDNTPYIVDAGFGAMTLTGPLVLEPDTEQTTPHEPFRLVPVDGEFLMQAKIRDSWKPLYRFSLQEQLPSDYEVTNWYLSNHPDSHFLHGLIAARPTPDRRYTLRNNEFAVHHLNGATERRVITSAAELRETLEGVIGVTLPASPELDATLNRVTS